jgi:hypothetical protein
MAVRIDLTLDCANATTLAAFWKLALGYEDEPPPAPFATRQEWLQAATGSPEERWARITQEVERLTAAGATVLRPDPGHHVVMADPEGNEFCVA